MPPFNHPARSKPFLLFHMRLDPSELCSMGRQSQVPPADLQHTLLLNFRRETGRAYAQLLPSRLLLPSYFFSSSFLPHLSLQEESSGETGETLLRNLPPLLRGVLGVPGTLAPFLARTTTWKRGNSAAYPTGQTRTLYWAYPYPPVWTAP